MGGRYTHWPDTREVEAGLLPKPYSSGQVPWLCHAPLHQATLCVPGCSREKTPNGHSHLQDNGDQSLLHRHPKHWLRNCHLPILLPVTPGPSRPQGRARWSQAGCQARTSTQGCPPRPGGSAVRTGSDWGVAMGLTDPSRSARPRAGFSFRFLHPPTRQKPHRKPVRRVQASWPSPRAPKAD